MYLWISTAPCCVYNRPHPIDLGRVFVYVDTAMACLLLYIRLCTCVLVGLMEQQGWCSRFCCRMCSLCTNGHVIVCNYPLSMQSNRSWPTQSLDDDDLSACELTHTHTRVARKVCSRWCTSYIHFSNGWDETTVCDAFGQLQAATTLNILEMVASRITWIALWMQSWMIAYLFATIWSLFD